MTVLVTGGAGYIGSHMTLALLDARHTVVVMDNLVTGNRALVDKRAIFVDDDIRNTDLLEQTLRSNNIETVIHFAGSTVVPDSVADPLFYYHNNTVASRGLIAACVATGVRYFIFSSTAAIYGESGSAKITEDMPKNPINPYGRSKLMTEWILEDASRAYGLKYLSLRYFNVAGADPKGRSGQSTPNATHLIKKACQVALGKCRALEIFGTNYPTPDGTGIRDYIHVSDLVQAHILGLRFLREGGASGSYNCGYGRGYSVREIVASVERVSGITLPTLASPRRPGDAAEVIADPTRLSQAMTWRPRYDDIDTIVGSALDWERRSDNMCKLPCED